MTKNNNQNLEARERRIAEARSLNLFSDVFMTAALQDPAACQHVLRILISYTSMPQSTITARQHS